ncbi:hypothetical protein BDR04DRAFT_1142960 [Suillus decipiens]|nr:hypothetical protein BDR04DRAFT_1142960 [Suillus decipiens]
MTIVSNDPTWWLVINTFCVFSYFGVAAFVGLLPMTEVEGVDVLPDSELSFWDILGGPIVLGETANAHRELSRQQALSKASITPRPSPNQFLHRFSFEYVPRSVHWRLARNGLC